MVLCGLIARGFLLGHAIRYTRHPTPQQIPDRIPRGSALAIRQIAVSCY
jgi:hypothetical protein